MTRRNQIVRQRARLKNIIQSILHAHLIPPCPAADLFNRKGRAWLAMQPLPEDERLAIERHVREIDRLGEDLQGIERDLARHALACDDVRRLMTIPGVDMVVAIALVAAIGNITRFASPQQLVSYLGLHPSVRQSGPGPAQHGRITKQGRGHARGMLVEAAWAAVRAPGPLHAFFLRLRARRGQHIAAVATARKLAVVVWHLLRKQESYAWARPALHARKLRDLELKAGHARRRGQRGTAHAYNLAPVRKEERRRSNRQKRRTNGSSPAGNRAAQKRARAPQRRNDNDGCAAGLSPHTRLFATRSPERTTSLTDAAAQNSCQ